MWAATGKADEDDRLRALGAAGRAPRRGDGPGAAARIGALGRRDRRGRWATMPYMLGTLRPGAAVASSGNAGGPGFESTVLPFILRGVAMLGMDSVRGADRERRALWNRLATDLRPRGLGED